MTVQRYFAITLLCTLVACTKNTRFTSEDKPSIATLTGTWQWVRTDGGIGFHIHDTPQTTDKTIELEMEAAGTYTVFTNHIKTTEGTYTLETRTCIHDNKPKTYIRFSSGQGFMVETLNNGTLEVSDEMYDGVGSLYQRVAAGIN